MISERTVENPFLELIKYGPATFHKPLSKKAFFELSSRYPSLQMEREKNGKIIIMTPVKKGSGRRESDIMFFVRLWNHKTGWGEVFSPSTGIELPDGSIKSPDCAWVSDERLAALPEGSDEEFLQAVPDFVAEVRSSSDSLPQLKKKMTRTWIANGVRLAWLIDPYSEKVWIYRAEQEPEVLQGFKGKKLTGEDIMPGLELPLDEMMVKAS